MRRLYRLVCPVFIVTQYEAFPDKDGHVDLSSLFERLQSDHPNTFRDLLHYGGATDDGWRQRLTELLKSLEGV